MDPGGYGWRGDRSLHVAYLADARGVIVPNSFLTTVDSSGARTRLDLRRNETAVLRKIPVTLTAKHPVNVVTAQYDESGIVLVVNGTGAVELIVKDGDFRVEPGAVCVVNGRSVRSGPSGVLPVRLNLHGETAGKMGGAGTRWAEA